MKNDEEERRQIIDFFKMINISSSEYELSPQNEDPPDARLNINGLRISLEHTRLMDEKLKKSSALINKILSLAKYHVKNWNTFSPHILFKPGTSTTNSNAYELAKEISDTILNYSTLLTRERIRIESKNTIMYLRKSIEHEGNPWQCPADSTGFVTRTYEQLRETVLKKQNNLHRYRDNYDKNWLLIYIDRRKAHGMFDIDHHCKIDSHFDKIFIMQDDNAFEIHGE